jgi:NADPH-dependent glutamate synthase beta subunit-like oxidoreductase/ferredoxin
MPRLTIDNREVEVDRGATILDAASKLGIEIPTMCFLKSYRASTSCMICVVRVNSLNKLVPACGTIAEDGMQVENDCEEVCQARKAALELLLSDHLGDCIGPCQIACPARMNIPLMIRQIAAGKLRDAIETVKRDIALPAVLGRICPKPCERVCRRAVFDDAISICLLKRYAADVDLQSAEPYLPSCKSRKGKRVAIVGGGPAGLAAAYYLLQEGYGCMIFDEHEKPGGMLRYRVSRDELAIDVLDNEIALIEKLGVEFQGQTRIGTTLSMEDLRGEFDAVFVAVGQLKPGDADWLRLETNTDSIVIGSRTYETSLPGVFAGGDAVRRRRLAVRAVADGKEAAVAISQYLSGGQVTGPTKAFNTHIGKLKNGGIESFVFSASKDRRVQPSGDNGGFTDEQARKEAFRCLHCDCRKVESCKLRQYAQEYGARPTRYKGKRRAFEQQLQHPEVIYEPGKCIGCGLCVQIASVAGESLGLTFIGRGFDVRVAVPFDHSIAEGLKQTASQCVTACPTGALAFKEKL